MKPFEPDNLSPLKRDQAACELPYGLTWEDLRPFLPGFDDREGSPAAYSTHAKQGLNGGSNSCILTLTYPAGKDAERSITVFIKQQTDAAKAEAQRYRLLASQGVPTPAVLAVIHKGEAEIILLEFLETIGIDFHSKGEVEGLLHLAARVNSVQAPPGFFFNQTSGMPQDEFDRYVRTALEEIPPDPQFPPRDPSRWFAAYQASQKACQGQPLAVNHGEFFFQQVGWARRGPTRELVLFDLETLSLRPRFSDLASILYALAVYSGRNQAELFQVYLDRLCQLTRQELRFDQAYREFRTLRVTEGFYSLPWLIAEAKNPQSVDLNEQLAMTVRCLSEDLNALGLV